MPKKRINPIKRHNFTTVMPSLEKKQVPWSLIVFHRWGPQCALVEGREVLGEEKRVVLPFLAMAAEGPAPLAVAGVSLAEDEDARRLLAQWMELSEREAGPVSVRFPIHPGCPRRPAWALVLQPLRVLQARNGGQCV